MSNKKEFTKIVLKEFSIGALFSLILIPIIFATNSTASLYLILIHALIILVGITIWTSVIFSIFSSINNHKLLKNIILRIISILLASTTALPLISYLSEIPFYILASKPFWTALIPIISAYIFYELNLDIQQKREHLLEMETSKALFALQSLTAQIKPHFLFNCLNGLEQLVDSDPYLAKENIRQLASLYRAILKASDNQLLLLQDEIELVLNYLSLQKMRYPKRLQFKIDSPKNLNNCYFPPTILLTLVENAIKHGVEKSLDATQISIALTVINNRITATVKNSVTDLSTDNTTNIGHGLNNIKKRLDLLFKTDSSFNFIIENKTAVATVSIPQKYAL